MTKGCTSQSGIHVSSGEVTDGLTIMDGIRETETPQINKQTVR